MGPVHRGFAGSNFSSADTEEYRRGGTPIYEINCRFRHGTNESLWSSTLRCAFLNVVGEEVDEEDDGKNNDKGEGKVYHALSMN